MLCFKKKKILTLKDLIINSTCYLVRNKIVYAIVVNAIEIYLCEG